MRLFVAKTKYGLPAKSQTAAGFNCKFSFNRPLDFTGF